MQVIISSKLGISPKIQISKGCGFYRRCIHAEQIIIVSGVSSEEIAVGTESFFMENGDLLPEGALRHNGQDRSGGVLENAAILLGGIRNNLTLCGRSSGGKCADLQTNHGEDGIFAEQFGIGEVYGLRFVFIHFDLKFINQKLRKIFLQSGNKLLPQEHFGFCVQCFVQLVLLILTALCPGIFLGRFQQAPVEDQINIFGKTMDQIKTFGKAGATFECQMIGPGALMEEVIQSPADSEIFLNDAFTETAICCGISEENQTLFLGKPCDIFHISFSISAIDLRTS